MHFKQVQAHPPPSVAAALECQVHSRANKHMKDTGAGLFCHAVHGFFPVISIQAFISSGLGEGFHVFLCE